MADPATEDQPAFAPLATASAPKKTGALSAGFAQRSAKYDKRNDPLREMLHGVANPTTPVRT
jgi:hypothetical protein